ncbi:MAG: tetratricopeptide repeat protein [Armatimonadetes bacterium]|nr:tetratricopeptide repeat protein [Armatimonadota bacterium]
MHWGRILGSSLSVCCLTAFAIAAPVQKQKAASPASSLKTVSYLHEKTGDALWARSDYCFHKGRWNDSIRICKVMMKSEPTFEEAYGDAGYLLDSLGRKNEALAIYKQGLAANPKSPDMYFEVARFYTINNRFGEALPYLQKAVKFPTADVLTWKQLAHTYRKLKMYDKSIATWQTIRQKFKDPVAENNIRSIQNEMQQNRM